MCRTLALGCVLLSVVTSIGCPSPRNGLPPSAKVKGTITIDDRPLSTGEIHFVLTGAPPSVLPIKEGAYSGEAPIGKNKVEVFHYVDGRPSEKDRGTMTKANTIPPKYWGHGTALEAAVEATGANEFKFAITSK
jgi:hypothetical protein